MCPAIEKHLKGVAIQYFDLAVLHDKDIGFVNITYYISLTVDDMKQDGDVEGNAYIMLPCELGKVYGAIVWTVEVVNRVAENSRHSEPLNRSINFFVKGTYWPS